MPTTIKLNLSGSFSFDFSTELDSHAIEGIKLDYEGFLKRCSMYIRSGAPADIGGLRIRYVTDDDYNFNTNKQQLLK